MNSFFLSRSLPPNSEGSAEPCEAIGACLRTQVRTFTSCNLCPDSSLRGNYLLSRYSHTDFYDRSRMTGRYLIPFCKKLFYVSAHTCPFRRLHHHLPRVRGTAFMCESIRYFSFSVSFDLFFFCHVKEDGTVGGVGHGFDGVDAVL